MTVRWKFEDMTTSAVAFLPINPNEMSSPTDQRSVTSGWTLGRPALIDAGATSPTEWTFGGVINTQEHYELLVTWSKSCHVLRVTDHLGRMFEIIIQRFEPIDRRRTALKEWRYTYTMTCLLLKEVT